MTAPAEQRRKGRPGTRPRLLDLFCGAGGCSVGYERAGFDVVGVDLHPQPNYPFEFHCQDALRVLSGEKDHPEGGAGIDPDVMEVWYDEWRQLRLDRFDAIHASPPCQAYSQAALGQRNAGKEYPDIVAETRDLLNATGLPWVIENVPGAPMRPDLRICGCMVGLELRRVRWFETSWHAFELAEPCHHPHPVVSVVGHGTPSWVRAQLGFNPSIAHYRAAMGIDWMNRNELSQAIPPAYTERVGRLLMAEINARAAA
jgi:DNA (cytosine-5)-methyltransferase 1